MHVAKNKLVPVALLAAGALTLSACSGPGADGNDADTLKVVASTSIWADVAQAVADSSPDLDVEVQALVEGNDVDPHHFEPTAADLARANEADVVIANGGGYDAWMYQALSNQDDIISALPLTDHGALDEEPDVMTATEAKEHPGEVTNIEGNEHIWYDAAAIEKVAQETADRLNELSGTKDASADAVVQEAEAIQDKLANIGSFRYAQTEPIADYLMKYTPATDATPDGYRKATVAEGEPTAADLARFLGEVNEDKVDVLIYNPQTETDLTTRIKDAAEDKDLPIVEIGETPPKDTNFLDYYEQVVDDLAAASK